MSQTLVFTGAQATFADLTEYCYETTFVWRLAELKVGMIQNIDNRWADSKIENPEILPQERF